MLREERLQQILDILAREGSVRVTDLSRRFNVSDMTIHRDLNYLASKGYLRKVHGGAVALQPQSTTEETCPVCYAPVTYRTQVVIHLESGEQQHACCPHCGLHLLARTQGQVSMALVRDFLHFHMLDAQTATYLAGPDLVVCCQPSVLAFATREEAERFQRGFGGQVMTLEEATAFVRGHHHMD